MESRKLRSEWLIHSELGAEYRDRPVEEPLLRFPWAAAWTEENTCVIVDRRRPRNVVREFDAGERELWSWSADSRANTAVPLTDGRRLVVEGTRVRALSASGVAGAGRPTTLPEVPNGGCAFRGGALVGCGSGVFRLQPNGVAEQLVKSSDATVVKANDVHAGPDGTMVVTDPVASCVAVFNGQGDRIGLVGRWLRPGRDDGRLLAPEGACLSPGGNVWVAETRLHRIAEFDLAGNLLQELRPRGTTLNSPASVRPGPEGTLLVADAGNHRVILLDSRGKVVWQVGASPYRRRLFSWPRSVEYTDGQVIVCDTFNDRALRLDLTGRVVASYGRGCERGDGVGLSIPRSASATSRGGMSVADGLNSRVLVLDAAGGVRSEITELRSPSRGRVALRDPHQAAEVGSGLFQIVDSDLNAVVWADERGRIVREWYATDDGEPLADPHQAHHADDGVYVADSANDRIAVFDLAGGGRAWRGGLSYPRFVMKLGRRTVVANTDDSELVWLDEGGVTTARVGPIVPLGPDVAFINPEMRLPKWIASVDGTTLAVADMLNSRILMLRRRPSRPARGRGRAADRTEGSGGLL